MNEKLVNPQDEDAPAAMVQDATLKRVKIAIVIMTALIVIGIFVLVGALVKTAWQTPQKAMSPKEAIRDAVILDKAFPIEDSYPSWREPVDAWLGSEK